MWRLVNSAFVPVLSLCWPDCPLRLWKASIALHLRKTEANSLSTRLPLQKAGMAKHPLSSGGDLADTFLSGDYLRQARGLWVFCAKYWDIRGETFAGLIFEGIFLAADAWESCSRPRVQGWLLWGAEVSWARCPLPRPRLVAASGGPPRSGPLSFFICRKERLEVARLGAWQCRAVHLVLVGFIFYFLKALPC